MNFDAFCTPACAHLSCVHQILQSNEASAPALAVTQEVILGLHSGGSRGGDGGAGQVPAQGTLHHVFPVLLLHLPRAAAPLGGDGDLRHRVRIHPH